MSMSFLDRKTLKSTLCEAVYEAWNAFKQEYPRDKVYGLGLYSSEVAGYIGMTVFSEEGLDAVASEYAVRSGRELESEKPALKWSPCDSPHHMWCEELFDKAQEVLDAAPDPYDDDTNNEERVVGAFEVFVDVLRTLDTEGTFGSGRSTMVLSVWVGDQSDEERIDYVQRLNPLELVERFEAELELAIKT